MATAVPVDVMRDVRGRIKEMKAQADLHAMDAITSTTKSEVLRAEALRLENLYDGWLRAFPDTDPN